MENIIVGLIICAAAAFTLYRMICKPKSGCGCGCDCGAQGGRKGKDVAKASCTGMHGSCDCMK